jgi:ABC-2 type transport system permease protein
MSYRRLRAIFIKELHHITRDSISLGMALAVPVMMLLLYGWALSLDVDHIPVMIYDQSRTTASRELIRQFEGSRYFELRRYVNDYAAIQRAIDRSDVLMALVIPTDYAKNIGSGHDAPVQLLIDGSDSNTAGIALGYAETVVHNYSTAIRTEWLNKQGIQLPRAPIEARLRVWYNSSLESKNYVVPGLIAVILQIIAALLTSLTITREWEMGTMEQLLSTPLRPVEIVLGKMLAYFVVGLVDAVISLTVALLIFGVPMNGSFFVLAASVCIFLFGALFWGIFVSAATKNQLQAYQLGLLSSFLPAFMLSGFVYSLDSMPRVIQVISFIVPARYIVTIMKGVFLKGIGFQALGTEFLFLSLYGAFVFFFATRKMNQKVA